jgi:hypothetical protein
MTQTTPYRWLIAFGRVINILGACLNCNDFFIDFVGLEEYITSRFLPRDTPAIGRLTFITQSFQKVFTRSATEFVL